MSKTVNFQLGPTTGIASRTLVITRMHRAGDDSAPSAAHNADAGAVTQVSATLTDNTIWQAVLSDVMTAGEVVPPQVIQFNTGELQFLGAPASQPDGSQFRVFSMEDNSSSSSSSSVSSSSSESSSSESSSSESSSSSSS